MKRLATSSRVPSSCLAVAIATLAFATACGGSNQTQPPPQNGSQVQTTSGDLAPRSEEATSVALPSSPPLTAGIDTAPPDKSAGMLAPVNGPTSTDTSPGAMNDAQITAVLQAAIDDDLSEARWAANHAQGKGARRLAERIAADEGSVGADLTSFQARHPMVAQGTPTSASLRADHTRTMSLLESARHSQFDQAYVDAQIATTSRLATLLDETLIPAATAPELKTALVNLRTMITTHARIAGEVQSSLREHSGLTPASTK